MQLGFNNNGGFVNLTKQDLEILTKPFPDEAMGVKVQSFSKDRTKASLVLYLQHSTVAARLDSVDPCWQFQVDDEWRDEASKIYYVKATLIVKGVVRQNVGEGDEPKGAYSDCLKRCAMLFGVGRHLYDSDIVWVNYNESTDKFKSWSMTEYRAALRPKKATSSAPLADVKKAPVHVSKQEPKADMATTADRDELVAFVESAGIQKAFIKTEIWRLYDVEKITDLTKDQFNQFYLKLKSEHKPKEAGPLFADSTTTIIGGKK